MTLLGLLLAAGPAAAHIPHDTMVALVVPPDLDPDEPWDILGAPHGIPVWERSTDAGRTFDIVEAEPTGDEVVGAARLADGTRVALSARSLWWTGPDGGWHPVPLPADVTRVWAGERVVVVGPGGAWGGRPDALRLESAAAFSTLGPGPSAIGADGAAWTGLDGAWTRLEAPGADLASIATVVTAGGTVTYGGTRTGEVLRHAEGGWVPCGPLPSPPEGGAPDVVRLAGEGDVVWAAAAWRGPFRSEDGCATWESRAVPEDPVIGAGGGAAGPDDTWLDLVATGDSAVIAGWGGVFTTLDAGLTWRQGPTVSSSYTRGLAFSSDFAHDGTVLYGTYGAAILAAVHGEDRVEPRDGGFTDTNVQQVVFAQDPALASRVYTVEAHVAWGSDDFGATWELLPLDVDRTATLAVSPDGEEVWAFSLDGGQAMLRSTDGGRTFRRLDSGVAAVGVSRAESVALLDQDATRCIGALAPLRVRCTDDGGRTWRGGLDGDGVGSNVVGWPEDHPTRLLVGDRRRVWRSDDGGHTWRGDRWRGEGEPWLLHVAPDGAILLGSSSGELWRSLDGGRGWERLPVRLTSRLRAASSRPDPAGLDEHLLGDADGVWILRGLSGEPTLERWSIPERIDDGSGFVDRSASAVAVRDPEAGMGVVRRLPDGAWVEGWVRGETVRVVGRAGVADVFEVWVDDALAVVVGDLDVPALDVLARVDDLAPGWHMVRVVGRGADPAAGVQVDAIEGIATGGALSPPDATPADEACGCASGGGSGLGGIGLAAAWLARRRGRWERHRRGGAGPAGASTGGRAA